MALKSTHKKNGSSKLGWFNYISSYKIYLDNKKASFYLSLNSNLSCLRHLVMILTIKDRSGINRL